MSPKVKRSRTRPWSARRPGDSAAYRRRHLDPRLQGRFPRWLLTESHGSWRRIEEHLTELARGLFKSFQEDPRELPYDDVRSDLAIRGEELRELAPKFSEASSIPSEEPERS